jgi:hypothetical protein
MLAPSVITANALLVWLVEGFMFGLGLALAWNLVGYPFRRWWP